MKTIETHPRNTLFVGILDTIAESLGRPRAPAANGPTLPPPDLVRTEKPSKTANERWLTRAGAWLWRRQVLGVDAYYAKADAMFAALDRWLWKQRASNTEAWLAQSQDLFELEARIRHLERRPESRLF